MLSYAIFNESVTRLKAADEAASPGAPAAIPGWLQTLLTALLSALGGGCLPPVSKASDLTSAVAGDAHGYIASAVHDALLQNHGRIAARILTNRGMLAIRHASDNLTPADDAFVGHLQASASAE